MAEEINYLTNRIDELKRENEELRKEIQNYMDKKDFRDQGAQILCNENERLTLETLELKEKNVELMELFVEVTKEYLAQKNTARAYKNMAKAR